MITWEKFRSDQSIILKKLGEDKKLLSEGIHNFEEKFENIGQRFESVREEYATNVEDLTYTISSLKQRCKKLQYELKEGKQTKKKKILKVECHHFSTADERAQTNLLNQKEDHKNFGREITVQMLKNLELRKDSDRIRLMNDSDSPFELT